MNLSGIGANPGRIRNLAQKIVRRVTKCSSNSIICDIQQVQTNTHFCIHPICKLNKDNGLITVTKRGFLQKFLPKSKQVYRKIIYSTSGQKLEEATYKGHIRTGYLKYNDKGEILISETFNPNTLEKNCQKLSKAGRYEIETYKGDKLIYKEYPKTINWNDSPHKFLFCANEDNFECWIAKTFDDTGNCLKTTYEVPFKDVNGVEKSYIRFLKKGDNMTEFNPDGSIKSEVIYRKKWISGIHTKKIHIGNGGQNMILMAMK